MSTRMDALFEIVRENQPTGIRFTYYTAAAAGLVPKTDNGYVKVQRAIKAMRDSGRMPWSWIVDTTRWMRKPTSYGSVDEAMRQMSASYRLDLWRGSNVAVEVWCESESVAGVLGPITEKWDVPLYPIKGQTSDSFAYGAAQQYRRDPRNILIIYVGDHDPAGYEIETNLQVKLARHSGRDDIEFTRMACTAEDVTELNLTGSPPKKSTWVDARTGEKVPWTGPAVEVEAITPPMLRAWLDLWISTQVDPEARRLHEVAERNQRHGLEALAGRWLIAGGGA